jgi:HD superfamily phosphohydrolase
MQRLGAVRQLGLANIVYPGARHTRFEHSLGVFVACGEYIKALMAEGKDPFFKQLMDERDIVTLLLAGLLHDIGHYPFAHAFEEIDPNEFGHTQFTLSMLSLPSRDDPFARLLSRGRQDVPILAELLSGEWGVYPADVIAIIAPFDGKARESGLEGTKRRILNSTLDGPVDCDKLDYLLRDSVHTGVPYGRIVDRERLLQSVVVDPTGRKGLILTEKGRVSAELFAICRYLMFSEVYWHHSVRALHTMLSFALEKYLEATGARGERFKELVFGGSEEGILVALRGCEVESAQRMATLIQERMIHSRLLVCTAMDHDLRVVEIRNTLAAANPTRRRELRTRIRDGLAQAFKRELRDGDILVDVPPEKYGIGSIDVLGREAPVSMPIRVVSPLWESVASNFDKWVRRITIFCAREVWDIRQQCGWLYERDPKGERVREIIREAVG